MATMYWKGGGAEVAQVTTWAMGGTWEATDIVRATIGTKTYDFVVGSTVTATIVSNIVTAWNALSSSTYPEFAEITASANTTTLVLTADTAGKPFTVTLTPLETGGGGADSQTIEGGTTATTGTTTTAATGPNHWDNTSNWSGGAVPANSDTVYVANSDDDIKYGLAQSAVTLAALYIDASFTGTIGLPLMNTDATEYPEYRAGYLAISATILEVGNGSGGGSSRLKIDVGSNACTLTVRATSTGQDQDLEALLWKGTHASNVVNIYAGELGVAGLPAETATVATFRIGSDTGASTPVTVRSGAGVTLTTVTELSGTVTLNSAATTITKHGGSLLIYGTGAYTTLTNNAGTVDYRSSGTVTTYVGGPTSFLDFSSDLRAKTVTNCTLMAGAGISDPAGVVTFTNPILLSRCKLADVTLDAGYNRSVQFS